MTRNRVVQLAGVLVALAVGAVIVRQLAVDWGELREARFYLRPLPLALSWAVQTIGWLLVVDTWRRILRRTGGDAPLKRHLQLYAYTSLARALPGSWWAPVSRVAFYRRLGVPGLAVGAATVVEWLLLGLAGLALYAAAAPFARSLPPEGVALLVPAGLAALGILHPRAFARALALAGRRLGHEGAPPRFAASELAGWFARELVVLALSGLGLYLLMLAIGPVASLPDALAAWALSVAVANLLAWLPATIVLKDGLMVLLLVPLYGNVGVALAVVVAWRVWMTVIELSWAAMATLAARGEPLAVGRG